MLVIGSIVWFGFRMVFYGLCFLVSMLVVRYICGMLWRSGFKIMVSWFV